jgi:hypothetical protein
MGHFRLPIHPRRAPVAVGVKWGQRSQSRHILRLFDPMLVSVVSQTISSTLFQIFGMPRGMAPASFTADALVQLPIVFFHLVNPDGVHRDQATDTLYRENRNPASDIPGNDRSIGAKINCIYDFFWDCHRHFNPSTTGHESPASDSPGSDLFHSYQNLLRTRPSHATSREYLRSSLAYDCT